MSFFLLLLDLSLGFLCLLFVSAGHVLEHHCFHVYVVGIWFTTAENKRREEADTIAIIIAVLNVLNRRWARDVLETRLGTNPCAMYDTISSKNSSIEASRRSPSDRM